MVLAVCFHADCMPYCHGQGAFLEKIRSENPGIPCFLFGHSTGGAVVLKVRTEIFFIPFAVKFVFVEF